MSDVPDSEKGKTFGSLVRIHEANCKIEYPCQIEQNFRIAVMKKLAQEMELRELQELTISGPGKGVQRGRAGEAPRA